MNMHKLIQRLMIIASLGLILAMINPVFAQSVAPPPGFAPAPDDDTALSPPPEKRIFTGSGDDFEPRRTFGPENEPLTRRYGLNRSERTFREPVAPAAILDDGPPLPRVWFRGEALYWWSKGSPVPVPVVTQGSVADSVPGALDQPGTSVLLGNQTLSLPGQGGGRYSLGFSFGAEQTWGLEMTYFYLANAMSWQGVSSDGSPNSALLAFPFFNPTIPGEDASPISNPGNYAGSAVLSAQSLLNGTDVNLLFNQLSSQGLRLDLLGGFRNVNLKEDLEFTTSSPNVAPNPPAFFNTFDQFLTSNHFYGAQVGARATYDMSRFFVNATGKLAFGGMFENVSVNGGTITNVGGFASAPGAYLSQPTNIGTLTQQQFAVIPEMNLNFGFRIRPWCSVIAGYSFLYISSVARPGDQIDRVINPSQSPAITGNFSGNVTGPARPELSIQSSSFWAQGLNFALEFRF